MASLLWVNNVASTLVLKELKHKFFKQMDRQGANISEKDAPHHYMRGTMRGTQPQNLGFRGFQFFKIYFIYLFFFFLGGGGGGF